MLDPFTDKLIVKAAFPLSSHPQAYVHANSRRVTILDPVTALLSETLTHDETADHIIRLGQSYGLDKKE